MVAAVEETVDESAGVVIVAGDVAYSRENPYVCVWYRLSSLSNLMSSRRSVE
jgi:hypothetical protein